MTFNGHPVLGEQKINSSKTYIIEYFMFSPCICDTLYMSHPVYDLDDHPVLKEQQSILYLRSSGSQSIKNI